MNMNLIGPALSLALGCIGSSIGCYIASAAGHAAMSRVEEGHAKFIALSATPASQSIYGIALMTLMSPPLKAGTLSAYEGIGIGLLAGIAMMLSSIFQGKVCATAAQALLRQPNIFGKAFMAVGIIESFALFALVFSYLLFR